VPIDTRTRISRSYMRFVAFSPGMQADAATRVDDALREAVQRRATRRVQEGWQREFWTLCKPFDFAVRRGGRVVECTALEMRHTGNRIGGSNPSLSASQ
jgi:hypothetical protein